MKDLERFVRAQDPVYSRVLKELYAGEKQSHWMWFIFPQVTGLGSSRMARDYALDGREDAERFLAHPVLGARLVECAEVVLGIRRKTAMDVFGHTDAMKLRSSATLFAAVSPPGSIFHRLLDRFFEGRLDPATVDLLEKSQPPTSPA